MRETRRCKVVCVTPEILALLCRSTGDECIIINIDGIPKDAKFIAANYDYEREYFQCKFEHESFDEIEIGFILPEQEVRITKYYV